MSNTSKFRGPNDSVTDSFTTNEDESDELFSDDDQSKETNKPNVSLDISILRSKTPLLLIDNSNAATPTNNAIIPSTPLSLLPFLNKINEQWTSDLETPQTDKTVQPHSKLPNVPENMEETIKAELHTPDISSKNIDEKITSDSPVIVTRVKRKRPKRRCIFKSSTSTDTMTETNNEDAIVNRQEVSIIQNDNYPIAQGNTMVPIPRIDSVHEDNRSQAPDRTQEMCDSENVDQLNYFASDTVNLVQEIFDDDPFNSVNKLDIDSFDEQVTTDAGLQKNKEQSVVNIERLQTLNSDKVKENERLEVFTTCATAINVSKEALLPANILAVKEHIEIQGSLNKMSSTEQKYKNVPLFSAENANQGNTLQKEKPYLGFQTAHGVSMNVSKQALSKAKLLFAKELGEPLESNIIEVNIHNKENKLQKIQSSNTAFQTARNSSIITSKHTLPRVKLLFTNELDKSLQPNVIEKVGTNKEAVEVQEAKTPSVGFQTARGASINISKQALSRANLLFTNELDKSLQPNATEKVGTNKEAVKVQEAKTPSVGFQTARGASINISKQALSRANLLFTNELDKSLQPNVTEKVGTNKEAVEVQEAKTPSVGFQTARGASINISKQALSRANLLFTNELDKPLQPNVTEKVGTNKEVVEVQEAKTPSAGFQTARGASINISKQALSRANLLFANETSKVNVAHEASTDNKTVQAQEIKTPNVEFQTARGTSINISRQSLSKAKSLFRNELNGSLESNVVEEANTCDRAIKVQESKTPSVGFQTARGVSANISKEALSRAKLRFANELSTPPGFAATENLNTNNQTVKEQEAKVPKVDFRTGHGALIGVSEQAFSRAQTLFANQSDSPAETSLSEKRKLDSDYSTPLGRGSSSGLKKVRLSDGFESRKLFSDYPSADTDNDGKMKKKKKTLPEDLHTTSRMSVDDDTVELSSKNKEAINITESPDERDQVDLAAGFPLGSPNRESPEPNVMSSPVIGTQPASRKRWSLEHRRSGQSAPQLKQISAEGASTVPRDAVPPRYEKMDMEESQKSAQTDQQKTESESTDYGDTQMMMDFIDESAQILQDRLAAALEQENVITSKRRHRSMPSPGYLYRYKQINSKNRVPLGDLGSGAPPRSRTYQELIDQRIPPNILAITATTAASYKFRCSDFYGNDVARSNVHGIELEDGARLVMDENGYVGVWEFLRAFLASPKVHPNLVPARWIENHYRWIVWKLASMDRMKFGSAVLTRMLTPSHVMAQLKYRYDREIDQHQRPAIRRILEKDDVASKRMVLCVSSIVENNIVANPTTEVGKSPRVATQKWKIELTDGWYSIPACIDIGMIKHVSSGKVREGTKLLIYGAELLNCDKAYYPLEDGAKDACLKLHTNSTRRARWDLKLGYASRSGPIPVRLHDVCPNGGLIGRMTIVVARVYPMLYHEKNASGDSVLRNAKSEEKAQLEFEQRYQNKVEAFYDKAEKDFQNDDLSRGTDFLAGSAKDRGGSTQEFAGKKRQDELLRELRTRTERYKEKLQSKLRQSLPAPRQVSPLLKVRVCDGNANGILSIWSPGEEVVDVLKEGACVSLRNVIAVGKRGCELQLTARRCALFKPGTMRGDASYPPRVCASFCEIGNPEFSPPYGEFDTVGFVCAVGNAPYGMKDFEVAHLAYPKTDSSNSSWYLSILFWQGIASYGYTEIFTVGSIVACNNLEWRRATSWNVPVAYCTDRSTFTRKPRRNHLYESFENLRNSVTDPVAYTEGCTAELNVELQKKLATTRTPTRYASDKNTPIKIYNSAPGSEKRPVDHTPSSLSTPRSTAVNNSWNSTASKSLDLQRRLEKLQWYGEPPELSPIVLRSSKRSFMDYRSPVCGSDATSTTDTLSVKTSGSSLSPEK